MPDLHIVTSMFDSERYEQIQRDIMGGKYGFCFETLFSINDGGTFKYKNDVKKFLRYISGSNREGILKTGGNLYLIG